MTDKQLFIIEVVGKILYLPVCFGLVALSILWFNNTSDCVSSALNFLWGALRGIPAILGGAGVLMGSILLGERWF